MRDTPSQRSTAPQCFPAAARMVGSRVRLPAAASGSSQGPRPGCSRLQEGKGVPTGGRLHPGQAGERLLKQRPKVLICTRYDGLADVGAPFRDVVPGFEDDGDSGLLGVKVPLSVAGFTAPLLIHRAPGANSAQPSRLRGPRPIPPHPAAASPLTPPASFVGPLGSTFVTSRREACSDLALPQSQLLSDINTVIEARANERASE